MKFISIILAFSLLMIFSSCYKDQDNSQVIEVITEIPKTEGDTGLHGHLYDDEMESLVNDYEIVVNENAYRIDDKYFYIQDMGMQKNGQLIEVYKDNQLIAMSFPFLLENDINKIKIKTLPELQFSTDRNINLNEDISVELPSNLLNSNHRVRYSVIQDQTLMKQMGVSAYDREGEQLALVPEAAFMVDIMQGAARTVASEETTLKFDISMDSDLRLYVYHREFEYWLEVGPAGAGELTTNQLGYYMIAQPYKGAYVEGKVSQAGQNVSYVAVNLETDISQYELISTENGRWATVVAEAQGVKTTLRNQCGETVGSSEFISEEGVSDYVIEIDEAQQLFALNAEVIGCAGEEIESSSVFVSSAGQEEVHLFSDNKVQRLLVVCDDQPFDVAGYDGTSGMVGPTLNWEIDQGDLEFLLACESGQDGYSYLRIKDEEKLYPPFTIRVENGETILESADGKVRFTFDGMGQASYAKESINVFIDDAEFGMNGYQMDCETSTVGCGVEVFEVTHYDLNDGWLRVSLSGELWMQTIADRKAGNYNVEGVIIIKT